MNLEDRYAPWRYITAYDPCPPHFLHQLARRNDIIAKYGRYSHDLSKDHEGCFMVKVKPAQLDTIFKEDWSLTDSLTYIVDVQTDKERAVTSFISKECASYIWSEDGPTANYRDNGSSSIFTRENKVERGRLKEGWIKLDSLMDHCAKTDFERFGKLIKIRDESLLYFKDNPPMKK